MSVLAVSHVLTIAIAFGFLGACAPTNLLRLAGGGRQSRLCSESGFLSLPDALARIGERGHERWPYWRQVLADSRELFAEFAVIYADPPMCRHPGCRSLQWLSRSTRVLGYIDAAGMDRLATPSCRERVISRWSRSRPSPSSCTSAFPVRLADRFSP
jgi:hypothetical protein